MSTLCLCHQTYNYSRPWSAPPVNRQFGYAKPRPLRGTDSSIWLNHPKGFTSFASTACSHKVHSWGAPVRAWVLAFIQSHKLVQMAMQKPYKCYNEGKELHSFQPCCEGDSPLMHPPPHVYVLVQGAH